VPLHNYSLGMRLSICRGIKNLKILYLYSAALGLFAAEVHEHPTFWRDLSLDRVIIGLSLKVRLRAWLQDSKKCVRLTYLFLDLKGFYHFCFWKKCRTNRND